MSREPRSWVRTELQNKISAFARPGPGQPLSPVSFSVVSEAGAGMAADQGSCAGEERPCRK